MAEDDVTPDPGEQQAEVEIDGERVTGTIPATAAIREGWFRSPGGVLAHADGPSQVAAFTGRGYTPVAEAEARKEIGDGLRLVVDPSDSKGTFDDAAVKAAVKNESTTRRRRG